MTELQKYLAEEVAEDLADGIITRREALRRLGLLGVSGSAATGLLATFAAGARRRRSRGRGHGGHRHGGSQKTWTPVARESITFAGPRGTLMAAWAAAQSRAAAYS